jgi:hypothetical protein
MTNQVSSGPAPNTVGATGFYTDRGYDYVTRCMIGYAAQGVMDIGRVFATIARTKDGDADSWYAAWRATAEKLHRQATESLDAGHTATAHRLFLSASEAYAQAIAFADGQSDRETFAPTFALQTKCWEAFVDSSAGRIVRLAVPYEGTTLPGFLFRPDASEARRPTVVMTNGSEGSKSGLWAWGASSALARGWNVFIYDGPGQQTMLFDNGHPFRPDWEAVLTPVVDSLLRRPDVDGSALFAYGCSQAGYWVTRALAFEHRFVAAAVDPGVMDVSTAWMSNLPPPLVAVLKAGNSNMFNGALAEVAKDPKMAETMAARARPFAKATAYETFAAVLGYNLREVIGLVKTPLMIMDPDDEAFWPGQSKELAQGLSGDHTRVSFSREDGTNYHCEPMARMEADARMLDFFQDHLARRGYTESPSPRGLEIGQVPDGIGPISIPRAAPK